MNTSFHAADRIYGGQNPLYDGGRMPRTLLLMSDLLEVWFRLTKCGRRGKGLLDVELYFPGPWIPAWGNHFNNLEETASSLFGIWLASNVFSYENLEHVLGFKPGRLGFSGPKHVIRVEARCDAWPGETYERFVVCEIEPLFREAREDEL